MFRLLSKKPYTKEGKLLHDEAVSKLNKFYRFTFEFDGSVSKLVQNLSGEPLIVNPLFHRADVLSNIHKNSLAEATTLQDEEVQVRYVQLGTKKLQTLLFARSYWSKQAFDAIMSKNPSKAIGLNLIDQRIEQFREVNWCGESVIKLADDFQLIGLSRSYSVRSGGKTICEVQQFFTHKFNELFY